MPSRLPGEMQTERDFNQQGEDTAFDPVMGHSAAVQFALANRPQL
jgi:hypothetical protein